MADVQVGNLLKLEIDGVSEALMFHKFDPPTLALENVTHNTWDDTGNLLPHSGGAKNPLSGDWFRGRLHQSMAGGGVCARDVSFALRSGKSATLSTPATGLARETIRIGQQCFSGLVQCVSAGPFRRRCTAP